MVIIFMLMFSVYFGKIAISRIFGGKANSKQIAENQTNPKLNPSKDTEISTGSKNNTKNGKGSSGIHVYRDPMEDFKISKEKKEELIADLPEELKEKAQMYPETVNTMIQYDKNYKSKEIDISEDVLEAKLDAKRKNIPYFNQWDIRWAFEHIQDTFMAASACGPTSLSSVYIGLTGDTSKNPYEMTKYATEKGWYYQSGSVHELMTDGARSLGLKSDQINVTEEDFKNAMDDDKIIIALVAEGDFTTGAHFIILTSYGNEGVYILDPNSYENTNKIWKMDRILIQTSKAWAIYK